MAVAWPTVKDRLVALIPTLSPAPELVFDGPLPTGEAPSSYACVGWQPSTDDLSAGSYEQADTIDGFAAEESGTVLLEFGAVTGDTDLPDAFGMVGALQAYLQATPRMGVLPAGSTTSLSVDVVQAQSSAGAVQRLLVSLSYFTRVI